MTNIDNNEKFNNLDISLEAWSKWRFIKSLDKVDRIWLKAVLKSYYEYMLLDTVSNKEYQDIEKLEWILSLLAITETKILGK